MYGMLNVVPVSCWTNGATGRLDVDIRATMPFDIVMQTATDKQQRQRVSVVGDGPARRACTRASCSAQKRTPRVSDELAKIVAGNRLSNAANRRYFRLSWTAIDVQ